MSEVITSEIDDSSQELLLQDAYDAEDGSVIEVDEPEVTRREADPLKELERENEANLAEWLREFGGRAAMQIALQRLEPKEAPDINGDMVKTSGHLETFDQIVSQEEIKRRFGGGKYQITVRKKNKKGRFEYAKGGSRTFDIAGPPIVKSARPLPPKESGVSDAVLDMAKDIVAKAEERAARLEEKSNSGLDTAMITALMEPLRAQIEQLARQNSDLQSQLFVKLGEKPDTSGQDQVLGLWKESNTDHSARVRELTATHESEMRQLREFHREEVRRLRDEFQRDKDAMSQAHLRELESSKTNQALALEVQKSSYDARIDTKNEIIKRLERELSKIETELTTLRAKKELSPVDQIQQIVNLKEAVSAMSGDQEESKTTMDRLLEGLAPLAEGVAGRLAGGGQAPPAAAQEEAEAQMVKIKDPQGNIREVPAHLAQKMAARQAAARQAAKDGGGGSPDDDAKTAAKKVRSLVDARALKQAIIYLETVHRNGQDPEIVARSAISAIPRPIIDYTARFGSNALLDHVVLLEPGSPLSTVAGRKFVADVASYLTRGTAAEPSASEDDEIEDDLETPVES